LGISTCPCSVWQDYNRFRKNAAIEHTFLLEKAAFTASDQALAAGQFRQAVFARASLLDILAKRLIFYANKKLSMLLSL